MIQGCAWLDKKVVGSVIEFSIQKRNFDLHVGKKSKG